MPVQGFGESDPLLESLAYLEGSFAAGKLQWPTFPAIPTVKSTNAVVAEGPILELQTLGILAEHFEALIMQSGMQVFSDLGCRP